jgi:hypothetical protein
MASYAVPGQSTLSYAGHAAGLLLLAGPDVGYTKCLHTLA